MCQRFNEGTRKMTKPVQRQMKGKEFTCYFKRENKCIVIERKKMFK